MESILKDVNVVVGVTGSFVCNNEGQILAKALPDIFDETVLSPVGRTMAQTVAGLELARRRKVNDLDIVYRDGRLVVKNLRVGYLCILCVPVINVPLLNLTANVAAKKLAERIKGDQAVPTERPSLREARMPPSQQAQAAADSMVDGAFFSEVEREFTYLMGPLAAFVLEEHISALGGTREAFPRGEVHQLVERLATEIEDEDKRARFQHTALEIVDRVA